MDWLSQLFGFLGQGIQQSPYIISAITGNTASVNTTNTSQNYNMTNQPAINSNMLLIAGGLIALILILK